MKKDLAKAAFLTAALIIVAPSFMRGQVNNPGRHTTKSFRQQQTPKQQ